MEPGTAVPVPARPNLEVEWTINPVLLRAKDGGQMLCHQVGAEETVPASPS